MAVIPCPDTASPDRDFERMYRRHQAALVSYCRWLLQDEQDALDVLQNVGLRAMVALRRGLRPERERAWLWRIAHNEAMSLVRSRRPAGQLDAGHVDTGADPAQSVVGRERSQVGTLWSTVARTGSARHGLRPSAFIPSKACGLVTS